MAPPSWSLAVRLRSFVYAARGLVHMVRHEANAAIHLVGTLLALLAGATLHISSGDWRWIVLAIALVWIAEAINTAIEALCNLVSPGPHDLVRIAKDVAAGSVLVAALAAALIGALTLLPYLRMA